MIRCSVSGLIQSLNDAVLKVYVWLQVTLEWRLREINEFVEKQRRAQK